MHNINEFESKIKQMDSMKERFFGEEQPVKTTVQCDGFIDKDSIIYLSISILEILI